jgi:hypothetical protein
MTFDRDGAETEDENETIEFVQTHLTDEYRVPSNKTFELVIYKVPRPLVNVPFCRYAGPWGLYYKTSTVVIYGFS